MKHYAYLFPIFAAFTIIFSCSQKKQPAEASINDKLELAFQNSSINSLEQIFIDWNKEIRPNSKEFIEQNDTIKAIFDAFKEFYRPRDLSILGTWEQMVNELNSNCKYVVVQNKIYYAVIDSDNFDGNLYYDYWSIKDSISNFKPPVNIDSKTVLYLTSEYKSALNQFLGTKSTSIGEPNIMSFSRPTGEAEKRYKMIRQYIPVLHGHWGGYWHLETHPEVGFILVNKNLNIAQIYFRVGYQGGEAALTKSANGWEIKESRTTWIE